MKNDKKQKQPAADKPVPSQDASASSGDKRLHVFFSGTVQGVGFRYTALNISKNFKVKGWVRNRSDGRVELLADGTTEELESFLRAIGDEMSGYIERVERTWEQATGGFSSFEIKPTE